MNKRNTEMAEHYAGVVDDANEILGNLAECLDSVESSVEQVRLGADELQADFLYVRSRLGELEVLVNIIGESHEQAQQEAS